MKLVASLVRSAMAEADDPDVPASVIARKALRIARLRNDWQASLWLQLELRDPGDDAAKQRAADEVRPHLPREEFEALWHRTTEAYIAGRSYEQDKMLGQSIAGAEAMVSALREQAAHMQPPPGLDTAHLYHESQRLEEQRMRTLLAASERELVIARVRQRLADYLSQTERQIVFSEVTRCV
jgi:hypothetical protein